MIRIDHLSKEFTPGNPVVNDISLHVKAGEVFGFLGPNGAGKTTTIKVLTTLLHPSSGTASVAGHDVSKDPLAVRMSFGYVGQQSGVDPAMTIGENLTLQGRLYHLPLKVIKERIKFLLDIFDMSNREGQWVGALSGGLKRRLDIATSLLHEPKLLFLDEPTLGLDPTSRSDLWTYLRRLNKEEGMTLFLTTHYLDEVDQLAHRVGILDSGRIRAIGTPDELKDSLGADAIHLTFEQAPKKEQLALLKSNSSSDEVIQQGNAVRLYLENGRRALPKVIQWLDEHQMSPKSVLLARPTFDDVYLKYTGKDWALADQKTDDDSSAWGGSGSGKWKNKWNKDGGQSGEDWEKWNKDGEQSGGDWENQWQNQTGQSENTQGQEQPMKEAEAMKAKPQVSQEGKKQVSPPKKKESTEKDEKQWQGKSNDQWQEGSEPSESSKEEWPNQWQDSNKESDKKKWPSDQKWDPDKKW